MVVFDTAGGSIGRSADNDWVLPDPQRYISAHHAHIHFRNGQYVLEDTSTNGVFVNDEEQPVGKSGGHPLQSGDVLKLGDYQMVVAVEANGSTPRMSTGHTDSVPTQIEVMHTVGRAAQTDLGAALNLDDLLVSDSPSGSRVRPVDAYGQAIPMRPARVESPAPAPAATPVAEEKEKEADDAAIARRIERLARAASKARDARAGNLPALYDVQSGLQAFCRGAGIDAERMPPDAQTRLMHLVGQLFRESLVGLKDLERSRHELHNRYRVELPTDPEDPRPSLARASIEDLLIQILVQHEGRRLDSVQWLRETLGRAKNHERAMIEAMREAFLEFIGRFDPAELEARFQRAARRGKGAANDPARHWELFTEFYRNLTEMPADHLPHSFVEAFATAYKKSLAASEQNQP